ncbi:hypothetical protein [Maribellus mangrovi]|uniref:hypothetical protein n=1 Tax=Maribellus mangrovi TaxID=3133146 RepID=UPI0030EBF250
MKQHYNPFKIISSRFFILILVLYSLAACAPTNKSDSQSETSAIESTSDLLLEINKTASEENMATETIIQSPDIRESELSEATESQVKLNPPHGEPGHRCDIAVGAPLDSSKPNTTDQTTKKSSETPVTSTRNNATLPSTGRVGPTIENLKKINTSQPTNYASDKALVKNPPHGQPGHRCDIPVGDPLSATASTNVKLNPPHGQPGHRCDIPVGSPLPS